MQRLGINKSFQKTSWVFPDSTFKNRRLMWRVTEKNLHDVAFPCSLFFFNHVEFRIRQINKCVLKMRVLFSLCVFSLNRPIKEQIGWRSHRSLPPCGLGNTKPISQLHQDHPRQHHRPAVTYLLKSKVHLLTDALGYIGLFDLSKFVNPKWCCVLCALLCAVGIMSLLGFPGSVLCVFSSIHAYFSCRCHN